MVSNSGWKERIICQMSYPAIYDSLEELLNLKKLFLHDPV